jgi:RimJ/RimL family protein N-acetyltransferase
MNELRFDFNQEILTSSLLLRPLNLEKDGETLFSLLSKNPELYDFYPYDLKESGEEYKVFLRDSCQGHRLYSIRTRKEPEVIIGQIGYLALRLDHYAIELGHIWIGKDYHGNGYGVEAGKALVKYALDRGLHRIDWKCHHENIASQKTALKIGMKYEGEFRNHMWVRGKHRHSKYYSVISQDGFSA